MWHASGKLHLSTLQGFWTAWNLLYCHVLYWEFFFTNVLQSHYCFDLVALSQNFFWVPTQNMVMENQWFLLVLSVRKWNHKSFTIKKLVLAQSKVCLPCFSFKGCNKRWKEMIRNSCRFFFPNIILLVCSLMDQHWSFYIDCVLVLRSSSDVNCGSFIDFSRAELFYDWLRLTTGCNTGVYFCATL